MVDDLLGRPVVTAADLDGMTPQQVEKVWRASIVTDADSLPGEYSQALRRGDAERLAQARSARRVMTRW